MFELGSRSDFFKTWKSENYVLKSHTGPPTIAWLNRPQHLGVEPCSDPDIGTNHLAQRNELRDLNSLGLWAAESSQMIPLKNNHSA